MHKQMIKYYQERYDECSEYDIWLTLLDPEAYEIGIILAEQLKSLFHIIECEFCNGKTKRSPAKNLFKWHMTISNVTLISKQALITDLVVGKCKLVKITEVMNFFRYPQAWYEELLEKVCV